MKKTILIVVTIVAWCLTSCADRTQDMAIEIQECEAQLDEFSTDKSVSFLDTVAEGDSYCECQWALEQFEKADSYDQKYKWYKEYMKAYKQVYREWYDLKAWSARTEAEIARR